jgi:hypothetical protein
MSGTWASGWVTGDLVPAAEFKKGIGCIYDTTLGVSAASIDISGIPTSYAHLMLEVYARTDYASAAIDGVQLRFNADTTANYDYQTFDGTGSATAAAELFGQTSAQCGLAAGNTAAANLFDTSRVLIAHYANASHNKSFESTAAHKQGTASGNMQARSSVGFWRSNSAISEITLISLNSANFVAGTRVSLYVMGA